MELPTAHKYPELYEKVSNFWKIVYRCKEYYLYCYHLHKPKSELEADYMNRSRFFRTTAHIYWRTLVIEIAKIYCDRENEKYNVSKFIRQLDSDGKIRFKKDFLYKWAEFINQNKDVIKCIVDLRDKYYAHTDTPEQKAQINYSSLTINQLEPLIKNAEEIIEQIHLLLFDSGVSFRVDFDEKDFGIITILANHEHEEIKTFLGPKFTFRKAGENF